MDKNSFKKGDIVWSYFRQRGFQADCMIEQCEIKEITELSAKVHYTRFGMDSYCLPKDIFHTKKECYKYVKDIQTQRRQTIYDHLDSPETMLECLYSCSKEEFDWVLGADQTVLKDKMKEHFGIDVI